MRHFSPVNASLFLRVLLGQEKGRPPKTETDRDELSQLLRYRLAVLEAALRRVDELQREAAKANQRLQCWVTDQMVQDVPNAIGVRLRREFDCVLN